MFFVVVGEKIKLVDVDMDTARGETVINCILSLLAAMGLVPCILMI